MVTGLRRHFVQMRAEDIGGLATAFSFSLTVTALEHIRNDARFAKGLFQIMLPGSYGVHIVPGPWSFFLYNYHGWRRYSGTRLVSRFEHAGFEVTELYALGGLSSFILHLIWISWLETCGVFQILSLGYLPPQVRRLGISGMRKQGCLSLYTWLLRFAVRMDRRYPKPAHGYALVTLRPE
jgi:hypothetical protein